MACVDSHWTKGFKIWESETLCIEVNPAIIELQVFQFYQTEVKFLEQIDF